MAEDAVGGNDTRLVRASAVLPLNVNQHAYAGHHDFTPHCGTLTRRTDLRPDLIGDYALMAEH